MEEVTPNQDRGGKSHFNIIQILLLLLFSWAILKSSELVLVPAGLLSPLLSWASHSQFPHFTYPTSSFLILLVILVTPNSNYYFFFF